MKKVTLAGKLSLSKETVAKLNDAQMVIIKGGVGVEKAMSTRCIPGSANWRQ